MINYILLMSKILDEGIQKNDTLSLFGETLEFDLREGFPIVTTRKVNYKAAFGELAAFLRGFTDVRDFKRMGVNFWDADCNKDSWSNNPNKRHKFDLGKIYGYQWTEGFGFNQIEKLIQDLKTNPTSRRHILSTFNPADLDKGCLPPCYVTHQFYSNEGFLDMLVHQRSADYCIGVPFDLCSYGLLQHLMAREVNLIPRKLKVIFGDVHIYDAHIELARQQEMNAPMEGLKGVKLPQLALHPEAEITDFYPIHAEIDGYDHCGIINYPFQTQN